MFKAALYTPVEAFRLFAPRGRPTSTELISRTSRGGFGRGTVRFDAKRRRIDGPFPETTNRHLTVEQVSSDGQRKICAMAVQTVTDRHLICERAEVEDPTTTPQV